MLDYCLSGYAKLDIELSHPTKTHLFHIAVVDAPIVDSSDPLHYRRWVSHLASKYKLEHKGEYFRVGNFVILHEIE